MMKFAAAGFICVDYYANLDNYNYATGNGVDVLYNLMSMRNDIEGVIVSAVGDDSFGEVLLDSFRDRGLDITHLDVVPGVPTASFGMLLNGRDRVHAYPQMGVMEDYHFSEEMIAYIAKQDYAHVDYQSELSHRLDEITANGTKVFFDFTKIRGNHPDAEKVYPYLECGLASFEEDGDELRSFLKHGCEQGAKVMIGTMGEKGSVAYDGKQFYECGIVPAKELVNTVGAGDSYFAGFISAWIDGKAVQECMQSGAQRSAQVVAHFDPYF